MSLDHDGQPIDLRWNAKRRYDRAVHELLGLIRGVLSDGIVSDDEILAVAQFGRVNPDLLERFPGNVMYERIVRTMSDRRIDDDERQELLEIFQACVGEADRADDRDAAAARVAHVDRGSSTLPLTDPPPTLSYPGQLYVVTGKFAYGARKLVTAEICRRGASCEDTVTQRTSFLLVGSYASRDWKQSSFGRKIEKAVDLREKGHHIAIVGEDHWVSQLGS